MRTVVRQFAAILLLAVSGCATAGALDQKWIEVSTSNFTIYSSLDERDARMLLEDIELFRAALLRMSRLRDTAPRVPTEIYAFKSSADYAPFRPFAGVVGYFTPGLRANWVAMDVGASSRLARAVLYHEYTHFLLRNEGRRAYPMWFDEGFAELLGSVDVFGAMVRIGAVPSHRLQALLYPQKLPYSRVIRAQTYREWKGYEIELFYTQSWLLSHYLILGQGGPGATFAKKMDRYLDQVQHHVDEEQAFREAFGIEVGDLEERFAKYVNQIPSFGIPRREIEQGLEITTRAVPLDEIGTRLGWLAMSIGKHWLAEAYFERAVAANPNDSRAIAGLADVDKIHERWAEAEAGYRRSLELAPDDWQNQLEFAEYFVDRAAKDEKGREAWLASARERLGHVIDLAPDIPEGYAVLGATYTIGDQSPEPGIQSLERAAHLLPSHPAIEFPLAKLHYRAGHRERAIELLRRIVHQSHGSENREAVEMLEALEGGPDAN
jgi:tetratricopeptide (TPR) repeat protein